MCWIPIRSALRTPCLKDTPTTAVATVHEAASVSSCLNWWQFQKQRRQVSQQTVHRRCSRFKILQYDKLRTAQQARVRVICSAQR